MIDKNNHLIFAGWCAGQGGEGEGCHFVDAVVEWIAGGILDLTFYARQGMYMPLRSEGAVELAINSLCIVGGLVALAFSWKLERGQS